MNQDKGNMNHLLDDYMSLQERVYAILRDWIISGELKPNDSLNANQLSKQLNVSRTPVRDAVNKLVSVGLAVKEVHKEAKVADFMSDEMYEIFRLRASMEGIAASSAARYMTDEQKEQLLYLCHKAEKFSIIGDEDGFMEMDQEMHFFIYEKMKTPILRSMAKQLYIISKHNRTTGYHIEGRREEVLSEHERLVNAIQRGDEKQAEEYGYQHLHNSITHMREEFYKLSK